MSSYENYHDKRRFFEMATCAMLMNGATSGRNAREVVTRVHELWDEITVQCPEPKESRDGDDTK